MCALCVQRVDNEHLTNISSHFEKNVLFFHRQEIITEFGMEVLFFQPNVFGFFWEKYTSERVFLVGLEISEVQKVKACFSRLLWSFKINIHMQE